MKTIRLGQPFPPGIIEAFNLANGEVLCVETVSDYDLLPAEQKAIHALNQLPDPEKDIYAAYQEKLRLDEQAAYAAFKASKPVITPKSAPPTLWQKTVAGTKSMLGMKGTK